MNAPHKPEPPKSFDVLELPDLSARPYFFGTGKINPPLAGTQEERDAAWRRFIAFADEGYVSDGTKMTRDEMNDRW